MCPADEFEVVSVHEVVGDGRAEQPAGAARTRGPVLHLLGVGPDEIAKRTF